MPEAMKTSERISRLADKIESVLDSHRKASDDPVAMEQLRSAAAELGASDAYTSGRLVELMGKAQVFYSARGFFRLPGQSQRLYGDMRHELLDRIRMRARVLASQGD
jgi:hypothetical protein